MVNEAPTDTAWNPGIDSVLPTKFQHLETMFRPENAELPYEEICRQAKLYDLAPEDMVLLKPMRLALHELLIRVSTQIAIPEGKNHLDLGFNYRAIVQDIYEHGVKPREAAIQSIYEKSKAELRGEVEHMVDKWLFPAEEVVKPKAGMLSFLSRGRREPAKTTSKTLSYDDCIHVIDLFKKESLSLDPKAASVARALYALVNQSVMNTGRFSLSRDSIVELAVHMATNEYASFKIGDEVQSAIHSIADAQGYKLLSTQKDPVVINVKGSSASGKTSLRPIQKALAEDAQSNLDDFAVISPDIWRKALLDYDNLGDAAKYAGTLTGKEIKLVDDKLDRLMVRNAAQGKLPNMLIDRFRSDSFASGRQASDGYTGSAKSTHMFFIVTPPESTIDRAWSRGLETGRYKAVDDLIAHNVETYRGMPELILRWIKRSKDNPSIDCTILDNGVPKGEMPKIIARVKHGELSIYDVAGLFNITRFAKLDVNATSPETLYRADAATLSQNTDFIKQCIESVPVIHLVDEHQNSYASIRNGALDITDQQGFDSFSHTEAGSKVLRFVRSQASPKVSGVEVDGAAINPTRHL